MTDKKKETRTESFILRMTPTERARLERVAEKMGFGYLGMSKAIRTLINTMAEVVQE